MNKKAFKYLISLIILLIALAFSGCVEINIIGEIDPSFLVTYQGNIELNLSDYPYSQQTLAQENLIKLCTYWQDIGYESQAEFDNDVYRAYFKKQVQCKNYEEAYEALFDMMTDEYSPFNTLSYEYIPYENYSDYIISGSMDLSDALDMDVYNSLNEDIRTDVSDEMQDLNATILFVLPHQENISQSSTLTKTYATQINAKNVTEFEFQGRIYNPNVSAETKVIIDNYNKYNKLNYVLGAILGILFILVVIVIIKLNKK